MRRRDLVSGTGLPKRDTSIKVDPSVINDLSNKNKPVSEDSMFVGAEKLEDGTVGLLIDRAEMAKRIRDKMMGETEKRLVKLANRSDKLFDAFSVEGLKPGQEDPVDELIRKKGVHDPDVIKIMDVKKRFAGYDLSAKGLAPKGSEEVKKYYEAMELLRTGKVVLPTVEEYEAQKKALEMGTPVEDEAPLFPEEKKEAPTEINKERNVNEMANDNNAQNVTPMQKKALDPSKVVKAQPIVPPAEVEVTPVETVEEPVAEEVKPKVVKAKPLNLAKLEAEVKSNPQPVEEPQPVVEDSPIIDNVTINVPEDKADIFMTQLDADTKEKITQARAIKINRVEMKDIPTATGTISSVDEYKRVVPRKISGEFKELALPNSGYIITVSSASSLEMASVIQRGVDTTDWAAQYKFCYEHLVTTSVGNMSYTDFVNATSTIDVEGILGAIYQLSQSVTRIELNCGNPKCRKSYPVEYNSENLLDVESLDERTIDQINTLIKYADNLDEAKALQEAAPVNQKTVIFIDDLYITLKHTDGAMIIQQQPVAEEITGKYNFLIPLIITNIKSITKVIDGVAYKLDGPLVIAEELNALPDESLREILAIEKTVGEEQYNAYSYALQGPFKCPHCNNEDKKIPVDSIAQLVFLKVQTLLEEVL